MFYCDIHTHLTHEKFANDREEVIKNAVVRGVTKIVVNGLEPNSNRMTLKLSEEHPEILPALGIYPIDAANAQLPADLPFQVEKFDVDEEIAFIEGQAANGAITAIGECGLDGYWVGEETFAEQERVFEALIGIALKHDLPLIIHTRKRELRCAEILRSHSVKRVNFHCFGGRTKHAIKWAEEEGWYFSIPPNAVKNEAFQKMLRRLPEDRILTETDAPYLAPERGQRNEPANVVGTVELLAKYRDWSIEAAQERVARNFCDLLGHKY